MSAFDEHVEMPDLVDDYLYMILKPHCGKLTIACVDAAWEGVIRILSHHVEREAVTATREAVRDA